MTNTKNAPDQGDYDDLDLEIDDDSYGDTDADYFEDDFDYDEEFEVEASDDEWEENADDVDGETASTPPKTQATANDPATDKTHDAVVKPLPEKKTSPTPPPPKVKRAKASGMDLDPVTLGIVGGGIAVALFFILPLFTGGSSTPTSQMPMAQGLDAPFEQFQESSEQALEDNETGEGILFNSDQLAAELEGAETLEDGLPQPTPIAPLSEEEADYAQAQDLDAGGVLPEPDFDDTASLQPLAQQNHIQNENGTETVAVMASVKPLQQHVESLDKQVVRLSQAVQDLQSRPAPKAIPAQASANAGLSEQEVQTRVSEAVKNATAPLDTKIDRLEKTIVGLEKQLSTLNAELTETKAVAASANQTAQSAVQKAAKTEATVQTQRTTQTAASKTVTPEPKPILKTQPKPQPVAAPKPAPVPAPTKWQLRSVSTGKAWISPEGSSDIRQVSVGDTVPGLGRITAIQMTGGSWVVQGTEGKVVQ